MAQTNTPPVHILRRRHALAPTDNNKSVREMYEKASAELKGLAPAEVSPKWLQLMEYQVGKILTQLDQMQGLSDPNRYRFTIDYVDEAMKAIFDKLAQTDEAFRQKKGTKEIFRFSSDSLSRAQADNRIMQQHRASQSRPDDE